MSRAHPNGSEGESEMELLHEEGKSNGGVHVQTSGADRNLNSNRKLNNLLGDEEEKLRYKCEEFDDILEIVGSQGTFQKIILYAIICPIVTLEPLFTLNTIFMLYLPDHWCHVPGRESSTSVQSWKNYTLPMISGPDGNARFSQCAAYGNSSRSSTVECTSWDFDTTDFQSTIPSDFNWVCGTAHYATDALTACAIGNAFGTIFFGQLADKYGRKPIFFITLFINIFFRTISLFILNHFYLFLVIQFVIGTAFPSMFISPSMIVAESCDKDYRAWVYAVTWMIWVGGMAVLPLIAWACGNWFYIGLATSIPGFLLFFYWPYLPESPRWLVSVGRKEEAAAVIQNIAKTNGTQDKLFAGELNSMLKRLMVLQDQDKGSSGQKSIGVWTLFSRPRLAKNTIMLTISWSMNILVYYGITLNTANMYGNQFVNFCLLSLIELPSSYLCRYLVDKIGRRWTQVGFFLISTACCCTAAIGVIYESLSFLVVSSILIAKFAITLTFLVVYLQGTEIFPTQLRSTGSGFAATIGSAAGVFGPYIIFTGQYFSAAPYIIMCLLSMTGMVASSFLPETFCQTLPETIEAANNFGKGNKFWSFVPQSEDVHVHVPDTNVEKLVKVVQMHPKDCNNSNFPNQ